MRLVYAWVAQQVEQWTENPCRVGSIPAPGTTVQQATVIKTCQKRPVSGDPHHKIRFCLLFHIYASSYI